MNCERCNTELLLCPADFPWHEEYWICPECESTYNFITEWGGNARCMTSDGRNINIADELNRLENEKDE